MQISISKQKTIPPITKLLTWMQIFGVNMRYTGVMHDYTSHLHEPMECDYYGECILRQPFVMSHVI